MSWLDLSVSFDYLCYGSTAIIHILFFQCGPRAEEIKDAKNAHMRS